ncbi:MAG: SGNH/GDSL hydrolase family protein [Lachnospiraceae bacterium]|nr:SGNH/GDSL hydrolase family protein [Lachnospiraceae bacterium]
MVLKGKTILFLGDSITEGMGASDVSKCYVSLIADEEGADCINYGISGTRIARQRKPSEDPKHDLDFLSRVPKMQEKADCIVVFGGTNDFGHGDAPLGTFEDRSPYTFYGALHLLYIALIEKYPDAHIVVITPLHRLMEEDACGSVQKETPTTDLKGYVEIIRQVAQYYSLPVLDLFATSGLQPSVPVIQEKFLPDGLHPSDEGYARLAHQIVRFLKSL